MYVSVRRYNFVAKVINNGHMEVKIVWSGNNGCHVSQEDVIKLWVAFYPSFPDSYSILKFPEQGYNHISHSASCFSCDQLYWKLTKVNSE